MVALIVSSVGPPVANTGKAGYSDLIFLTISAVSLPPETFNIVAPDSILAFMSSSFDTTVTIIGISIVSLRFSTISSSE